MSLKCGCSLRVSALLLLIFNLIDLTGFAQTTGRANAGVAQISNQQRAEQERENLRKREAWFLRGRLFQGHTAPQLLMKAQQQRAALRLRSQQIRGLPRMSAAGRDTTSPGWTSLGPSPLRSVTTWGDEQDYGVVTGRATAVAVDQNDVTGNTVYVGGAFGGVWKSTTAANQDITKVRWKALIDEQPTQAVGAIAIDPEDSNIVLVGTGEANSTSDSYYGLGILRSADGGNSWTLISSANNGLRPFHGLAFAKIAFNSDNPTIVVAATASASEGMLVGAEQPANDGSACADRSTIATCRGLYYSYDSGQTWAQVAMVDPGGAPDNGSASDVVYNPSERRFYAWSRGHGLYWSADGMTFTRAADQGTDAKGVVQPVAAVNLGACPTTSANVQTCPMYRGQIALVPGRDEMYVWFVDASTMPVNGGIYQTKDGGQTWEKLDTTGIDDCGDSAG